MSEKVKTTTREELIALCEAGVVDAYRWSDRDSADAQMQLGTAWALLKSGCDYTVSRESSHNTVWVEITYRGFNDFEEGHGATYTESFYIPTQARLDKVEGKDWY